ncbi:CPBP family intramembrane glutamic endopeptidase [Cellulomonas sp. S1-8]|uniref:CPBP family intramembrane glutamic endopeptidase n=1 Tax=Cellulomonas sp. S1-8 TaxID=2904790 RepID=UPI0022443AED|nr:CPBP family intramembrane glutamic endopeptidase [Cellulomonas sp. S1-8]UZN03865.1 CPBP family intramembrane metalloprotease [Cellulomonas sp. S1-8]
MRVLKQVVVVVGVAAVGSQVVMAVEGSWPLRFVVGVAVAVLALLAYAWVVRRTEHRAPVEVGRARAGGAFGRGLLLGALWCGAVIACIAAGGGYRVESVGSLTVVVGMVGFLAAGAVAEELMFRGLLFRLVEERTGTWVALVVSAVLFGAIHLMNPDASLWGAVAIAVEAGGVLGAAYAATRTLWLPIGLHLGWNFALGGVFGAEVSGSDMTQGLLHGVTSGPQILTGGAFGPEGSIYAVAGGVVLTGAFLLLAHRRGTLVPMRRREARDAAPVTL